MRRLRAGWTFFLQWLRHPRRTAAVTPSGAELTTAMLAQLPPDARRVIELGGGTGPLTEALLAHGIATNDLLVLEINPELHDLLRMRFPQIRLVQGDARELSALAGSNGYLAAGPADAVMSSLGLLSMDRETQSAILRAAFACLRPDGVFVQFTYGPRAPLPEALAGELGLHVQRGEFVLRNVPPATVYVYSRSDSPDAGV